MSPSESVRVGQVWMLRGSTGTTLVRVAGIEAGNSPRGGLLTLHLIEGDLHPSHGLRERDLWGSPNAELIENVEA